MAFLIWVVFIVIGVEFLLSTMSGRKREDEGPKRGRARDGREHGGVGGADDGGEKEA